MSKLRASLTTSLHLWILYPRVLSDVCPQNQSFVGGHRHNPAAQVAVSRIRLELGVPRKGTAAAAFQPATLSRFWLECCSEGGISAPAGAAPNG